MENLKQNRNGTIAITQIILLLVGIIAIGYAIGSEFKVVSAQGTNCLKTSDGKIWDVSPILGGPVTCVSANCQGPVPDKYFPTEKKFCESYGPAYCKDNSRTRVDRSLTSYSNCQKSSTGSPEKGVEQTVASAVLPGVVNSEVNAVKDRLKSGLTRPVVGAEETGTSTSATGGDTTPPTEEGSSFLSKIYNWKIFGSELKVRTLIGNAAIAVSIYYGIRWAFGKAVDPDLALSIAQGASVGFFIGKTIFDLRIGALGGWASFGIGLGIAVLITVLNYKRTQYKLVQFTCQPWDAPTGGKNCELCNKQDFPCTEYQCKTLGQACQLVNSDTPGEELCVWVNRGDVVPPVIQPWENHLTIDYKYSPNNAISPPNRGVKIVRSSDSGCVKPFTPITFGITLDEPGKCKIDGSNVQSFDAMKSWFGGSSTSKYNHSQTMSLPSPESLAAENATLENGGNFNLYVRCQDANGNANTANFVFSFCVDEGPDTTAPLIVTTSILNGHPIASGQTSTDLQVYTNEPSECRWSKNDKSYDDMENPMTCSTNVFSMNAQNLYTCATTLTGLKDSVKNDFYFRCKDQPSLAGTADENKRNANTQSYKFTLQGTKPLVIDSVGPNETIRDSTDVIKVTLEARTSQGYKDGEATCYFSDTNDDTSFIEFYDTGSYQHTQDLYLTEGDYTYYIKCVDLGGNTDTKSTSFRVETDTEAPAVVRAFYQENSLKIITDENATCVYDNFDCNYAFEDGIQFTESSSTGGTEHSTDWTLDKNFYIKCSDEFGNQPLPNECNIVVRPSEI